MRTLDPDEASKVRDFIVVHAKYFSSDPRNDEKLPPVAASFTKEFEQFYDDVKRLFFQIHLYDPQEVERKFSELPWQEQQPLCQRICKFRDKYQTHAEFCNLIRDWLLDDYTTQGNRCCLRWRLLMAPFQEETLFKKFLTHSRSFQECRNQFEIDNDRFLESFLTESEVFDYHKATEGGFREVIQFFLRTPLVAEALILALPNLTKLAEHFGEFLEGEAPSRPGPRPF